MLDSNALPFPGTGLSDIWGFGGGSPLDRGMDGGSGGGGTCGGGGGGGCGICNPGEASSLPSSLRPDRCAFVPWNLGTACHLS